MKLYSDFAVTRTRQLILDLVAILVIVLGIWAGVAVHRAIVAFAAIGRQVEKAGTGFQSTMSDAARAVSGIPLVGNGVRAPFDKASGAGRTLAVAGAHEQSAIAVGAVVIGIIVALVPIYFVVRYLLLRRIRFVRAASVAASVSRLPDGLELLALRALATADAKQVLRVDPSVVERWRGGDQEIVRRLAEVELRRSGVRLPAGAAG